MGFKAWPKNPRDPSPFKINYLQIGGKLSDNIYPIVKHFLIGRSHSEVIRGLTEQFEMSGACATAHTIIRS